MQVILIFIVMKEQNFIELKDLEVYRLSRKLSSTAWTIYSRMNIEDKKHMGDQYLRAVDSIGANLAEGYGRFHYLDKVRFYYNSRGSHFEAFIHWLELLSERGKISDNEFNSIRSTAQVLLFKINNFIKSTVNTSKNEK